MQPAQSNPIDKALWYIESHFAQEITLDEVAQAAGVSRFHMTRAFGEQFGITPEELRARGCIDSLDIVEPIRMNATHDLPLDPPRFVDAPALLMAGLTERYSYETCAGIPAQWQRFQPYLGRVPGQVGNVAYGVCYNNDAAGNIDYMSGVQVEDLGRTPGDLARLRIPAQRYAVFTHRGHISTIRGTWKAIFCDWIPASGHQAADAPSFERYDERFDARTGSGALEIWLPIKG